MPDGYCPERRANDAKVGSSGGRRSRTSIVISTAKMPSDKALRCSGGALRIMLAHLLTKRPGSLPAHPFILCRPCLLVRAELGLDLLLQRGVRNVDRGRLAE